MTRDDAKQLLRIFGDTPADLLEPCVHGHSECSTTKGGACLDDLLSQVLRTGRYENDPLDAEEGDWC